MIIQEGSISANFSQSNNNITRWCMIEDLLKVLLGMGQLMMEWNVFLGDEIVELLDAN